MEYGVLHFAQNRRKERGTSSQNAMYPTLACDLLSDGTHGFPLRVCPFKHKHVPWCSTSDAVELPRMADQAHFLVLCMRCIKGRAGMCTAGHVKSFANLRGGKDKPSVHALRRLALLLDVSARFRISSE
eukprot:scaffold37506_cov15-Tisochrysis_lutea.AAC.2